MLCLKRGLRKAVAKNPPTTQSRDQDTSKERALSSPFSHVLAFELEKKKNPTALQQQIPQNRQGEINSLENTFQVHGAINKQGLKATPSPKVK